MNEGVDPAVVVAVILPSPVPLLATVKSSVVAGPQSELAPKGPLMLAPVAVNLVSPVPFRFAL